ncbi:MAG: hypothetical protein K0V04_45330 [Deltaproteobacteria bacterium]|nr:hypothetical protein [Deltaproteobacteria bacterium]
MNDDAIVLTIGAGPGPREARRFVGLLADALLERLGCAQVTVHAMQRHGEDDAPQRVVLSLPPQARLHVQHLVGPHLLLAQLRGPRARRRWFVNVELDRPHTEIETPLPRHELDVRCVRSRGPGGQNVNKRSTAVQITHRPTSISVACDRHRSQARNRADALENLRAAVAWHTHERDRQDQRTQAWRDRRHLKAQTPVMRWRLDPREPDALVPA